MILKVVITVAPSQNPFRLFLRPCSASGRNEKSRIFRGFLAWIFAWSFRPYFSWLERLLPEKDEVVDNPVANIYQYICFVVGTLSFVSNRLPRFHQYRARHHKSFPHRCPRALIFRVQWNNLVGYASPL